MRLNVHRGNNRTKKICRNVKVFLNDTEVTKRCFAFSTKEGWVRVFKTNQEGKYFIEKDEIAKGQVHGRVRAEI